MIESVIYFISY